VDPRAGREVQQQPVVAGEGGGDRYFVQVGSFIDLEQALQLQEKLHARQKQAVVWTHHRGDYRFYGVQVPAGTDFAGAKAEEQRLVSAGFSGTVLVGR
jgi:cell division protein FtsN